MMRLTDDEQLRKDVKKLWMRAPNTLAETAMTPRVAPAVLRGLLALAALVLAGLAQYQLTNGSESIVQLIMLGAAAVMFGVAIPADAVPLASLTHPDETIPVYRLRSDRLSLIPSALILVLSLFLFWREQHRGSAFVIWIAAMVWYVTSYMPGVQQIWSRVRQFRASHLDLLAVGAGIILLAVAVINFWDLGSIPYGLWWDEANFGLYAQQILHHSIDFPLLAPFGDPSLEFYLHAIEQQLFGATEFSTRVLVAISGIIGVGLLGLVTTMLWNRWVALVAMAVLGFMRWHVNFSRFGIHEMTFQLFELAVVVTLLAGIKQRKPIWFALCGIFLGLSIHIYSPAFALTVLVLLVLAFGFFFLRPRLSISLIVLVLVGFTLAYAPLLEAGIQDPALFNARAKEVSVFGPNNQYPPLQALEHNLRAHALMFNVDGDHNGRHNIPGQPQLDDISAVLFVLGITWMAFRARRPQYAFLILWFLAMMAPGVLSLDFEAPQSGRAAGAQPVVALFISLALCSSLAVLGRTIDGLAPRARLSRVVMTAVALSVLTVVSVSDVSAYFDAEVHNESVWEVWATDATFVGKALATLPATELIYFSPEFVGHPSIAYLAPGHPMGIPLDPARDLPFWGAGPIAAFLSRNDSFYVPLLREYYPHARVRVLQGPQATTPPLAYEVQLARSDVTGIQGLNFQFVGRGGSTRMHVASLEVPSTTPTGGGSATWTGGVRIASYGRATLTLKAPGRIAITLDGRTICAADSTLACAYTWPQGDHALQVRVDFGPSLRPRLTWTWSGAGTPMFFDSPLMSHGLTAFYYSNAEWRGKPTLIQREPQVDYYYQVTPLLRPFSVEWRGSLDLPRTGRYMFALDSVDDSSIALDGKVVAQAQANHAETHTVSLTRGRHRVVVRLRAVNSFTHIFLTWMPPGTTSLIPVPSRSFRP